MSKQALSPFAAKNITEANIENALIKCGGIYTDVAKKLKCTRQNIQIRVRNSKRLQDAKYQAKETVIDCGESSLIKLVKDKNLGAVCFLLKCLGKERGYVEQPIEKPIQLNLQVNVERLGEALRSELEHKSRAAIDIDSDPLD